MDNIPGEVIFVLIFIIFSVVEGLGRKRKAQQRGGGAQQSGPRPTPPDSREGIPRAREPQASARTSGEREGKGPESSEGLIPEDIWEEILGLARGAPSQPRKASPKPPQDTDMGGRALPPSEPETLEEIPPFEARSLEPLEPRPDERRALPDPAGTPAGGGRSEDRGRSRNRQKRKPALATTEIGTGPGVKAPTRRKTGRNRILQDLFGDGSAADLRKAVILQEVLGKPVGLED